MSIMMQVEEKLAANILLKKRDKIDIYNIINCLNSSELGICFDNLLSKLDSLNIVKKSDISQCGPIDYNVMANEIHIDEIDEISRKYYLAVYMVYINFASQLPQWSIIMENKGLYMGIASLNARLAVGNEANVEDYFDEEVVINLIAKIIGEEDFFKVINSGNIVNIISKLVNTKDQNGDRLYSYSLIENILGKIKFNFYSRHNRKDYRSILAEIEIILTNMFFKKSILTDEEINKFSLNLVDSPLFVADAARYPDLKLVGENFTKQRLDYDKQYQGLKLDITKVKNSLEENKELNDGVKLFILATLQSIAASGIYFNCDNLVEKLKSLNFEQSKSLTDKGLTTYYYTKNTVGISEEDIGYDVEYMVAYQLIMINFNSSPENWLKMHEHISLYAGMSSQLAKLSVGNDGDKQPFFDEEVIINLLSQIVPYDKLVNMFINGDFTSLTNYLLEMKDELGNQIYSQKEIYELYSGLESNYKNKYNRGISILPEIEKLLITMFFKQDNLKEKKIEEFKSNLVTKSEFCPGDIKYDFVIDKEGVSALDTYFDSLSSNVISDNKVI